MTDIQRALSGALFISDLREFDFAAAESDLCLMVGVLEHLPLAEGHKLLEMIGGRVLVSTPSVEYRSNYELNPLGDPQSHCRVPDFALYPHYDFSDVLATLVVIDASGAGG